MRAVVLRTFGPPETLTLEDMPDPTPSEGEVLIRVHAVTVNQSLDVRVRHDGGEYGVALPLILGVDPSGIVEAIGSGVEGFEVGDRVYLWRPITEAGGYAELVAGSAQRATHLPRSVSFADGSFICRHFPMAYSMARVAELTSGEWALVTGAAGPLGYSVAQVAKRLGAKVIVAASTERRVAVALTSGADTGISYGDGDLTEEVMRVTEGRGVDVVFENIGDPATWPAAFSSMAVYGRLVTVAAHGGGVVPLDTRLLYNNRLTVKGGLGDIRPGDTSEALRLATEGVYHTLIDRIMPLADAVLAHRMVEDRQVQGKLVLDPTLM